MVIHYFAMLRDVTRVSQQTWNHEPVKTMGELLEKLCAQYGSGFARWVRQEDGGFGQYAIILVNGNDIRNLQGLQTPLDNNDSIAIFPPIAGG